MEGVRQSKYSILDLEEDKLLERDHTKEERDEMQMEARSLEGGVEHC